MKSFLATLVLITAINAYSTEIAACNARQWFELNEIIKRKKYEGYIYLKLMKNKNNQTVGFYSWNKQNVNMFAMICEYIDLPYHTVSSAWSYWDNETSSNPAHFNIGDNYRLTEEEGIAFMKIVTPSKSGQIEFVFSIIAWDLSGNEKVVRSSLLTLD